MNKQKYKNALVNRLYINTAALHFFPPFSSSSSDKHAIITILSIMDFSAGCMPCIDDIDMQVLAAMAATPPQVGFEFDPTASPFPAQPPATASPEVDTAAAGESESADERRLRRRISNRESARRSRARKQRRLDELRDTAAVLERRGRELAAGARAARGRLALALLANAGLRAEAAVLSRRLAASGACTTPPAASGTWTLSRRSPR
ncbi:basic leucine zipper 43 [Sorghum bicolor]|jgi:hypothetical protein|nr:basic leucine zipper 43 [Sorghum bicolor]|eukprot:XP_002464089.2 basic leucine zipper 43 [Sorghum bicolor]